MVLFRSPVFLSSSGFRSSLETAAQSRRSFNDGYSYSLAAEVGSRTSPYSKLTASIQTTKQLENLFENSLVFPHNYFEYSFIFCTGIRCLLSTSSLTVYRLKSKFRSEIGVTSVSSGNSSFYTSFGGQRMSGFNAASQYPLLTSGSAGYELGTSFAEDDQSKNVSDENGVISLVTGLCHLLSPLLVTIHNGLTIFLMILVRQRVNIVI